VPVLDAPPEGKDMLCRFCRSRVARVSLAENSRHRESWVWRPLSAFSHQATPQRKGPRPGAATARVLPPTR